MKNLLAIVLAVVAFAYAQVAWSQTTYVTNSAGWREGISATGQKIWFGPAYQTKTSAQMGQAVWNTAVKGGATVTTAAKLATATGEAALVVKGVATGANIFLAVKTATSIATGPVGLTLTALTVVPAVVDYFTTPNTRLGPLSARESSTPFEKALITNGQICTVAAPCYEYQAIGSTVWFPSDASACDDWVVRMNTAANVAAGYTVSLLSTTYPNCIGQRTKPAPSTGYSSYSGSLTRRALPPTDVNSIQWLPASMDDIAPYMDAPEKITTPAQVQALLDKGVSIPISYSPTDLSTYFPPGILSQPVTGPASVSGVPTVKTSNDGTKTTTTTTTPKTDLGYSTGTDSDGKVVPKVTATSDTTTVTTVKDNATGATTTTDTTTDSKPIEEKPDYSFTDTPFGDIPKLYERKYPDGLVGVWNSKIAGIKATPLFTLLSKISPVFNPSGTCPNWHLPLDIASWAGYGSVDVSPPCWIWDFGKVVIVCSALLLARRLVFGG